MNMETPDLVGRSKFKNLAMKMSNMLFHLSGIECFQNSCFRFGLGSGPWIVAANKATVGGDGGVG
jgi:hypothetical protein